MRIRSFLSAVLLTLLLLPASLSSAESTDEDMALGGIRIVDLPLGELVPRIC